MITFLIVVSTSFLFLSLWCMLRVASMADEEIEKNTIKMELNRQKSQK